MNDYISRDLALTVIGAQSGVVDKSVAKRILMQLPAENIRAEWTDKDTGEFHCSHCGFVLDDIVQGVFYTYCPICGSFMGEENNG